MPVEIRARSDLRKQSQRVELDGTAYRIDLTWRQRAGAWYLDLYTRGGSPIALGRRLDAGWAPLAGVTDERLPPGGLIAIGPSDYRRDDLGDRLRLIYFSEDEAGAFEARCVGPLLASATCD